MHFAVVNMEVQTACRFQYPVSFHQPRFEKSQVIIEQVDITPGTQLDRLVSLTLESHPVALLIAFGPDLGAGLLFAGVERRVNINKVDTCRRR